MTTRLTGRPALAYRGVEAAQPANSVQYPRDPTTRDYYEFNIGDYWLNKTTEDLWVLVNKDFQPVGGVVVPIAKWVLLSGGFGSVTGLRAQDLNIANPDGVGKVNVVGAAGSGITTTADNIFTLTIHNAGPSSYSQGDWIPVLSFGGGTAGIAYTIQSGKYVQIGGLVYVAYNIEITSRGGNVGVARIDGLPFPISATVFPRYAGPFNSAVGITIPVGYDEIHTTSINGTTQLGINADTYGGGTFVQLDDTSFAEPSSFGGSLNYVTFL